MAAYFPDSSDLGKNYHLEVGTDEVDRLMKEAGARHFISRLSLIEMQSVFAVKVRAGAITAADFQLLRRRFLSDVTQRRLSVVRMTGLHSQEAERLIRKHGTGQRLRTLDALQLSVSLDLRNRGLLDHFVCADKALLIVASAGGFSVIDPEQP